MCFHIHTWKPFTINVADFTTFCSPRNNCTLNTARPTDIHTTTHARQSHRTSTGSVLTNAPHTHPTHTSIPLPLNLIYPQLPKPESKSQHPTDKSKSNVPYSKLHITKLHRTVPISLPSTENPSGIACLQKYLRNLKHSCSCRYAIK